ncbi:MAG: ABC transporter permease subunit [Clostridia bacterium]|nr:ABC transporter permease subunit [Clostridia bacterium]
MGLKPYDLPVPSEIGKVFITQTAVLWRNFWVTAVEAIVGLVIGSLMGFGVAVIASLFPGWGYGGLALMSAINAIPTTAMAPIMSNWFGRGMGSKIAVVIFFSMAAMAINTYRGLTVLPPFAIDLMSSYNATKKEIFLKLRLPNCVPSIFTALKVTCTTSMLSAIIAEFFSSYAGLGYKVNTVLQMGKNDEGWAYIACAAAFGILLYLIISLVESRVTRWHASQR